jgi:hypothetical protein
MAFFCTYLAGTNNVWGIVTSNDNGVTWTQTPVEIGLANYDYPSEPNGVYLGNGKILAIGRMEASGEEAAALFQMESSDSGTTWTRSRTNITDIGSSTSSLIYDFENDIISEFYVDRNDCTLRLRENSVSSIWNNPTGWNASTNIHTLGGNDGGNVNATMFNGVRVASEYLGNGDEASIYVTLVPYDD